MGTSIRVGQLSAPPRQTAGDCSRRRLHVTVRRGRHPMSATVQVDVPASSGRRDLRTVLVSCVMGTTVEWYDFFLYGTAAGIVFNKQFFPSHDPTVGTLLAFTTFAIGFIARPIGGLFFGHLGDRLGRKQALVITMLIMGVATFLIGCLPTYGQVGLLAPALLVLLRLCQGVAIGGEWGGAVLMSVEYAPPGRRALFGSVPQMGLALGLLLGTGVFALGQAVLSEAAFFSWGWRVGFWLSLLLVVIGLVVRLRVMETPAFRRLQETESKATVEPSGSVYFSPTPPTTMGGRGCWTAPGLTGKSSTW